MILEDVPPVHVHNPKKKRRKHDGVVISELETKEYKVVFWNRRLMGKFDPFYLYMSDFFQRGKCANNYLFFRLSISRGVITHYTSF